MARKSTNATDAAPPPESTGGGALASIEAGADTAPARDPAEAAARLSGAAQASPEPSDDAGEGSGTATPEKRGPGRPLGSRNRTGKRSRSGSRHPTRADLKERAEAAEARLAQLEAATSPDSKAQLEELAAAIAGAGQFMADMYIAGKPEREGWRLSEAEAARLGELWAVPLLPHVPALGAAAPWVMASIGTGKLVMDKARAAREVAAKVKALPEGEPKPDPKPEGGGDAVPTL